MTTTEFLARRVYGYAELDDADRQAINDFSLLWPAFEGTILETDAKPGNLIQIAITLRDAGQLDMGRFAEPLAYFRDRYWRDGDFTLEYQGLYTGKYNAANRKLVADALSSQPQLPEDTLAGLLLVVYRLRNNLFHGVKWAYGIRGQRNNFLQACAVLMGVMELYPN